ncbi:MAG: 3-isopropylmalate dehydratase large subunit [Cyclobacteriaceae bacterium]|nr:3-isopropylmalate dehydratase large subunit [Cyclobacteriaceae bacterium]
MGKTLFDKVWEQHVVKEISGGINILYVDLHLIHEVTSPQAFSEIEERGLPLFRKEKMIATADHNVPTINQHLEIKDDLSRKQVQKLGENCDKYAIEYYALGNDYQGIVHVIGPELGYTLPGKTIVCGDSHTSTHGAFGAIAFGIGTSQVAQVMASQCLIQTKPKTMRITVDGELKKGVLAKDVILYIIAQLSADGGTGYFIEYAGSAIESLSMEGRMTVCNMSIEMGARGGMIAPDDTTFDYIKGRQFAPSGNELEDAIHHWKELKSDNDAIFDKEYQFDAADIAPMITYGTNPGMGIKIDAKIPMTPDTENSKSFDKALKYMNLKSGESLIGKPINHIFIGSCTNSRIEDLREVAAYVKGKQKAKNVNALIVPGSKQVELQAKKEGLDKIFSAAGFELREPGCSACLAMNEDKIPEGEYCISTSNRNFEGRQGPGARTLLSSPLIAAATAIAGKIIDVRDTL